MTRILVLGGYGVFGSRIAERLARAAAVSAVVVAGRDGERARSEAARLDALAAGGRSSPAIEAVALDANTLDARTLQGLQIGILVNTAGPFQGQDYTVARAAIAAGAHYIDIADDRRFVTGLATLDEAARDAGVLVTSGASSVPALAGAVIDRVVRDIPDLRTVEYAISPGNSFDPGVATTEAILKGIGRPFVHRRDGREAIGHGWQPLTVRATHGAGRRLLGAWDVPDYDLFPARWPSLETHRFMAGVEVGAFHVGLWGLAWLVRSGLVRRPERLARLLLGLKRQLAFLGSDVGLMRLDATGFRGDGRPSRACWRLVARRGNGPYVPGTPAVIVAKALAAGNMAERGARACLGLFDLAAFEAEVSDLAIDLIYDVHETELPTAPPR